MTVILLILQIPAAVLFISYIYLARYYKKFDLLNIKIHESGKYTLIETVFYLNHFLRELFIDTLFVLCILWSYSVIAPGRLQDWGFVLSNYSSLLLGLLFFFLIVVSVGSIGKVGAKNTLYDLFQYRELDTIIEFGSHWKMHFLSTLFIMLLLVFPGTLFGNVLTERLVILFLGFYAFSVFFGVGKNAIVDKRWLMHGGREIATFFLFGFLPAFVPIMKTLFSTQKIFTPLSYIIGLPLLAIGAYISGTFIKTDVKGLAQGNFGMPYLLASHFFEHVLDFVYMLLLAVVLISYS